MRSRNLLAKGRCVDISDREQHEKVLNQDKASSSEEMKKRLKGLRTVDQSGKRFANFILGL